jgi:hypothetical protein
MADIKIGDTVIGYETDPKKAVIGVVIEIIDKGISFNNIRLNNDRWCGTVIPFESMDQYNKLIAG